MSKVSLKSREKNGMAAIYLYFSAQSKAAYHRVATVPIGAWDGNHITGKGLLPLDMEVQKKLIKAQTVLASTPGTSLMTAFELRELYLGAVGEGPRLTLVDALEKYASRKEGRTRAIYLDTAARVKDFDPRWMMHGLGQVTRSWLQDFDTYLEMRRGNKPATRSIHLRNIRTVINEAVDDGMAMHYPFRHFRMPHAQIVHRALTMEQLRTLASMQLEGSDAEARDTFFLSFFLIGMNPADIFAAREPVNGRVRYRRAKTGKLYDIKITGPAAAIIRRYKAKGHLLGITARYKDSHIFNQKINNRLKSIMPGLTMYWARHTWGTIAASIGISMDDIALSLGHSSAHPVTSIYVQPDYGRVDVANDKVIAAFLAQ